LEPQQNNVEVRPVELYVQMGYVVANLGFVAPQLTTVGLVARANVNLLEPLHHPNPTPSPTPSGGGGVGSIISASLFDQFLKYRNDGRCKSNGFYTYNAFIAAARSLVPLAQMVMLIHVKGRLQLSWLKPLTRPQVSI
jgi:hypothetical protein